MVPNHLKILCKTVGNKKLLESILCESFFFSSLGHLICLSFVIQNQNKYSN